MKKFLSKLIGKTTFQKLNITDNFLPNSIFEISVASRFESYFCPKAPITKAPEDRLSCKILSTEISFIDLRNLLLKREISDLTSKFYHQINHNNIFENSWSIRSFF